MFHLNDPGGGPHQGPAEPLPSLEKHLSQPHVIKAETSEEPMQLDRARLRLEE